MKIALIGQSGVGKTTVAKLLCKKFTIPHLQTGTVCRHIAQLLLGSDSKDNTQKLDDVLTQLDPAIFYKATLRKYPDWVIGCVLDSLRFSEDHEDAISNGFKIIRVISDQSLRMQRLADRGQNISKSAEKHRSELELQSVAADVTIENDLGFDNLDRIVRDLDW